MSVITTVLHTDSAFVFGNAPGNGQGSWVNVAAIGALGGINYKKSTTVGDKVTISWRGRCLYLIISQDSLGSDFSITTDGVTKKSIDSCNERTIVGSDLGFFRVPICIERSLIDGNHTTVIQSISTQRAGITYPNLYINGAIVITGPKTEPSNNTNIYDAIGDSWTFGVGAYTFNRAYAPVVQTLLSNYTKKDWTLNNLGISGSGVVTRSTNNLTTSLEQVILANTHNPNVISLLHGVNDLRIGGNGLAPYQFANYYRTILMFIDDVFNTSKIKVILGTPGYITSYYRYGQLQSSGNMPLGYNYNQGEYEDAVHLLRGFINEFPWIYIADVYAAMNENSALVLPNSDPDVGLHPNNAGHGVIAIEIFRTIINASN